MDIFEKIGVYIMQRYYETKFVSPFAQHLEKDGLYFLEEKRICHSVTFNKGELNEGIKENGRLIQRRKHRRLIEG